VVSQMHRQLSCTSTTTSIHDHLLRVCAGGAVDVMHTCVTINGVVITDEVCSRVPFGSSTDSCMVCLSSVMVDPIVLPCRHVLCLQCMHDIARLSTAVPRCPSCRSWVDGPVKRPNWVGRNLIHVASKKVCIDQYVRGFLEGSSGGRLCIISGYAAVAHDYLSLMGSHGVRACIYGFGQTPLLTDERVVICSFASYDRYVHAHCTELLLSDIERSVHGMSKVLQTKDRRITLLLMRGCSDEFLFRQWCGGPIVQ
jgi:hypothetical protein